MSGVYLDVEILSYVLSGKLNLIMWLDNSGHRCRRLATNLSFSTKLKIGKINLNERQIDGW